MSPPQDVTHDADLRAAATAGDPLALARLLVATPSVNPELEAKGAGEEAVARLCAGWLAEWGLETALSEVAPGRWNVLARMGGGERRLLLNGHLDTVGVAGMDIEAFDPVVRDGRLHGRGACDMKAGVAAILATAARLAEGGDPGGELVVALTADEEHASIGMQALVEAGLQADFAVVCEPTGLAVMPAHKGFAWMHVRAVGRAAHGSRPDLGVDAIRHMGRVLAALDVLDTRLSGGSPHPLLGRASVHAGVIRGGSAPSVYPAECLLDVERRVLPGETAAGVEDEFSSLLSAVCEAHPELDLTMIPGLFRPGTEVPADHPAVQALLGAVRDHGAEGRVEGMSAWVDAAFLNEAGTPAVCFGPGSIEQAHTAGEFVEVDQLLAATAILEDFARRWLSAR